MLQSKYFHQTVDTYQISNLVNGPVYTAQLLCLLLVVLFKLYLEPKSRLPISEFSGYNCRRCSKVLPLLLYPHIAKYTNENSIMYCSGKQKTLLFTAVVNRKLYYLLQWLTENSIIYCSGKQKTLLFTAVVNRKLYYLLQW